MPAQPTTYPDQTTRRLLTVPAVPAYCASAELLRGDPPGELTTPYTCRRLSLLSYPEACPRWNAFLKYGGIIKLKLQFVKTIVRENEKSAQVSKQCLIILSFDAGFTKKREIMVIFHG